MDKNNKLKEKLFTARKSVWNGIAAPELKKLFDFSEGYKDFLSTSKIGREAISYIVKTASKHGYKELHKATKSDQKFFVNYKGSCSILANIGDKSFKNGFKIIASHVDSPQLDLKSTALYEAEEMAYLKTKYYGGIKKYQWVTIPLAMHGVVVKKDGKLVNVVIGENEDDPVFTVNDLLIHLAQEQVTKTANKVIEGEQLNILVGSIPYKFKSEKDSVKLAIMDLLNKRYGIVEEDFVSAELHLVPAGRARDVGLDRSFVGAHGQDDRACVYTSLKALLETEKTNKNLIVIFLDKEEIGSYGDSSADSNFFERVITNIMSLCGVKDFEKVRDVIAKSKMLSADVTVAVDPEWKSVMDMLNSARTGYGVTLVKSAGTRGKYNANDTHPEFVAEMREALYKEKIKWQIGELGKVDQGGGGTVAIYFAYYGMDVIECGPALLSVHSPFEIASKADIYNTYQAYKAFYKHC